MGGVRTLTQAKSTIPIIIFEVHSRLLFPVPMLASHEVNCARVQQPSAPLRSFVFLGWECG